MFSLEFYQLAVDGRTTDDIFAIAIAVAIAIQWNSLLRFTVDRARITSLREAVADTTDEHVSAVDRHKCSTMLAFLSELKSVVSLVRWRTRIPTESWQLLASKSWKFLVILKFH